MKVHSNLPELFGSEAEEKAGRPYFYNRVNYTNGVPDKHYAIIVYAVKTPTGRYAKYKWATYYAFDFKKTLNRSELITKALKVVADYGLPRLRKGYKYDGPYLYGITSL